MKLYFVTHNFYKHVINIFIQLFQL